MLVLSRRRDEVIRIGDAITITVVDIRGDKVRLGIDAPREVSVHRQEVFDAIQREVARQFESALPRAEEPQPPIKPAPAGPDITREIPPAPEASA